jgi:hypothetical protein
MPFEHYCHCGKWGAFGVKDQWYCGEHRPMQAVSTRFIAHCEFCKRELDVRAEGTHVKTTGWVKVRDGGGGHGVSLPRRENKWAHEDCIKKAIKGGQEKML